MLIALSVIRMGYTFYQSVNKEMDLANVYYVTPSVLTVTFVS